MVPNPMKPTVVMYQPFLCRDLKDASRRRLPLVHVPRRKPAKVLGALVGEGIFGRHFSGRVISLLQKRCCLGEGGLDLIPAQRLRNLATLDHEFGNLGNGRGVAFGIYTAVQGLGALAASVVFGLLWKAFGAATAFGVGAALALLATAVLFIIVRRS